MKKNIKKTHFKTITDSTRGSREQQIQKLTPFKTPLHVLDRDLVKNRGRQTYLKTMGKSGIKVSRNLTPFKTPDIKHRTSRVHFKTFDDWVKARKTKCDMVLKDVSSFISEKNGGRPTESNRCTNEILPQLQTAQQLVDKEEW